jgi:hypothetical protein
VWIFVENVAQNLLLFALHCFNKVGITFEGMIYKTGLYGY